MRSERKKQVKLQLTIVALLFVSSILSCSPTDMERQFEMERAIDGTNRLKQQFYLSGGELDDSEYGIIKDAYVSITEMVAPPPDDSIAIIRASAPLKVSWQMAGLAHFNLGLLKMEGEDYDGAYDDFEHLITHYGFKPHQVQTAMFMQAVARYKQNRFFEAVMLYNAVAQYYVSSIPPETNPNLDALESPLTAAKILLERNDISGFNRQIHEAIDYYWSIMSAHQGTPLADAAIGKLASAFLMGELADSAVAVLSGVTDRRTAKTPPLVLFNIANIQQLYRRDFSAAEAAYRRLIEDYPNHSLKATAQLGIGACLFAVGKYEDARMELALLEKQRGASDQVKSEAAYLRALSYQREDNWPRALAEFDYVWFNFPISAKGMETPIHVAEFYLSMGESKLASDGFAEAERDYLKLIDIYSARSDVVARAMSYLARCHTSRHMWQEAVETLKTLGAKYQRTPEGFSAYPKASDILLQELNKPEEAASLLKAFVRNYPGAEGIENVIAYADSLERTSR
jgi:TolA-binding protein